MVRNKISSRIDLARVMVFLYVCSVILFSYNVNTTNYTKIVGLCLFGALFFIGRSPARVGTKATLHMLILFAWYLLCSLGLIYAENSAAVEHQLITLFQILAITIVIAIVCIKKLDLNPIMLGFITACTISAILSITSPQYYSVLGRWVGTLGNANLFGIALMFSISFCIYYFLSTNNYLLKIFFGLDAALLFYTLLNTGSRKAIFGVAIFASLIVFNILKKQWKKNAGYGLFAFVLISASISTAGYFIANSKYFYRIDNVLTTLTEGSSKTSDGSLENRVLLYDLAINQISKSPVIGIGLGNYASTKSENLNQAVGTYSHSNVMEVTVSTGILGALIFYSFHFLILLSLYRILKHIRTYGNEYYLFGITASLFVVFMAYELAMVSYYEKVSWLMIIFIFCATHILRKITMQNNASSKPKRNKSGLAAQQYGLENAEHKT